MTKRILLLLLLILPVGPGGCYWHDSSRGEYRPRDYGQVYNGTGFHRQGENTHEYEYGDRR